MSLDRLVPVNMPERIAFIEHHMLDGEAQEVYRSYAAIVRDFAATTPEIVDIRNPENPERLDAQLKKELVRLAAIPIRNSLKKLTWLASSMVDATREPGGVERVAFVVYDRIAASDFLLSEYRDIMAHKDQGSWQIQVIVKGLERTVTRSFPFWRSEIDAGLNNHGQAAAWYREQLAERKLLG